VKVVGASRNSVKFDVKLNNLKNCEIDIVKEKKLVKKNLFRKIIGENF
jgi:hypothetical protein